MFVAEAVLYCVACLLFVPALVIIILFIDEHYFFLYGSRLNRLTFAVKLLLKTVKFFQLYLCSAQMLEHKQSY